MNRYLAFAGLFACLSLAACDGSAGNPVSGPSGPPVYNVPPPGDDDGGGGGGGGGGEPIPPFSPPPQPFIFASDLTTPAPPGGGIYHCEQIPHAFWGFSNDVVQGTIIYLTGVVVKNTPMHWGIYNQAGQLVREHWTQNSRDNCVVHHEPEGVSTAGLAPGYYYLYASYVKIVNDYGQDTYTGYAQSTTGKYVGPLRVR